MKTIAKKIKRIPAAKRHGKPITTTSIAFKSDNLEYLKNHKLHQKDDLSVSWIVNKLIENFKEGGIALN